MKPTDSLLLALAVGMLTTAALAGGDTLPAPTRELDLSRNGRLFDQFFQRFGYRDGQSVVPEARGVRLQIPAAKDAGIAGYQSSFSLVGDFEVAVDFEVVAMPRPTGGYGVSMGVTLDAGAPVGSISLVRGLASDGRPQFTIVRGTPVITDGAESTKYETDAFPASQPRGRIILRREGAEVACLATDGMGGQPTEFKRVPYTDHRVRYVKLHADTGGSPTGVTGRFTGVTVRAQELVGGMTRQELDDEWTFWWWWIPVFVGCLTAAWVIRRRAKVDV
jgi:hypothetical protein